MGLFDNFFGKKPENITKNDIESELKVELTNQTTNLSNILNEQITNISTSIVNKTVSTISQGTGGQNDLKIGNIFAGDDTVLDLNQTIDIQATNQAVIEILTVADTKNSFASDIISQLQNKTANNSDITASMQSIAALTKGLDDAGGLASMLKTLTDTLPWNQPISQKNILTLKNAVDIEITNTTLNQTTINNIIKNTISNSISNMNAASCNISVNANNRMIIDNIELENSGKVTIKQVQSIIALNSCVNKLVNSSRLINEIASTVKTSASNETENKTKVSAAAVATGSITNIEIQRDAVGDTIKSLFTNPSTLLTIVCVGILVLCCIFGFLYSMFYTQSEGGQEPEFTSIVPGSDADLEYGSSDSGSGYSDAGYSDAGYSNSGYSDYGYGYGYVDGAAA